MKTVFELNNGLPFDRTLFERMQKTASDILNNATKEEYTQAIVLLTSKGKEYCAVIENALSEDKIEESSLLGTLISEDDTEIYRILCMWQDGGIDLPSYTFRKMLCESNSKNLESGIFVKTNDGYSVIKLSVTLK